MTQYLHDLARLRSSLLGDLRLDRATRILYATDASIYRCEPAAVFFPADEDDLVRLVRIAASEKIPVLPRGAGTSLSGQAISPGIVVDLTRWNSIRVDGARRRATVGPGAVIEEVNRAGAEHGLRLEPAPASANRATVAGFLANNGSGARSVKFGMAADRFLGARVLLPDGSIRTFRRGDLDRKDDLTGRVLEITDPVKDSPRWPKTWRNASGLDIRGMYKHQTLLPLFCGSEGSLGIILEAEVELVPRPKRTQLALFHYDTLVAAMEHVPELLKLAPSAVELMDRTLMNLAAGSERFRLNVIREIPEALLVVEFEDADGTANAMRLGAKMIVDDPGAQAEVWKTRKEGLGILMSTRSARRPLPFIEDCAVPVPALPAYVTRLDEIIRRHGTEGAYYAHASAGCLHIRPLLDLHDAADRDRMNAIMDETVTLVAELGGTLSGEHGDGRSKRPYIGRIFGEELAAAFEAIQRVFDPAGIFRPDDATELRAQVPVARRIDEIAGWKGGFALELERCNGEAACRKLEGVMCPSFQATGDELLSTRGRANLLRAWMAGESLENEIEETLKKCLGCKACASECPSQVDMSAFKAQFRHARGATMQDKFFGNFETLSRLGRVTGVPLQGIVKAAVGIHSACRLPSPARRGFMDRIRDRCHRDPDTADAILFVDTHMEYYEPGIGLAAMKIFDALGLKVTPLHLGCCGRPAFSRGLVDKARRDLGSLQIPGSCPVLVAEPSCLSMLRDDGPLLSSAFRPLSTRVRSIEEFLLEHESALAGLLKDGRPVAYHSHCHQKAMHLESAGLRLMKLAGPVTAIDSGCCGMAGSFGYESENYDLSMKIASDRFLPALSRARQVRADVALPGRSCREQAERCGHKGTHPLILLAERLAIS